MDKNFDELLKKIYALLQPLGYRKEASNYRLFCSDGLCRIISIQRNKWNTNEQCEFLINIGVYFEKGDTVSKRNFKEYDCQIRKRVDNEKCGKSEWWYLDYNTTIDELLKSIEPIVADGLFCREIDGLFCRSSPDIIVRRRCVLSHKRRGWLQPSPSFRYSRNLALQDELYHPVINNGPAVLVCVDKRLGTGPVNQSRDAG